MRCFSSLTVDLSTKKAFALRKAALAPSLAAQPLQHTDFRHGVSGRRARAYIMKGLDNVCAGIQSRGF